MTWCLKNDGKGSIYVQVVEENRKEHGNLHIEFEKKENSRIGVSQRRVIGKKWMMDGVSWDSENVCSL